MWRQTILKAINFLLRRTVRDGDSRRAWHLPPRLDRGPWRPADRHQRRLARCRRPHPGTRQHGEIVYGLFSLAERLRARDEDAELYERVVEEARWGLDWVLKTSFGDGYRNQGSVNSRWTDGIIGTSDDITSTARNSPMGNFTASAAEAIAARVLKESDPGWRPIASRWRRPTGALPCRDVRDQCDPVKELWRGRSTRTTWSMRRPRWAFWPRWTCGKSPGTSAMRTRPSSWRDHSRLPRNESGRAWDVPLLGFFYTGPGKDRILHYCHRGREQAPILH